MNLNADDAFDLLAVESQHRNIRLREVAEEHLVRHARSVTTN